MPAVQVDDTSCVEDLAPLPPVDTLLQVRIGKIRALGTAGLRSAIAKTPRDGKLFVTNVGIVGDEQQYVHHGGVDKALHQYCAAHYKGWQKEKPDKAHLFVHGAYGENLVSSGLNEDNVCIGDTYRIGKKVVVRVSEPRLPCYKLNHRFEWNRAAIRTQQTGRTGWYLSVLQTGNILAGDKMVLIERPYPRWSIRKSLDVMFREPNPELLLELSKLVGLGEQIREIVEDRLVGKAEDQQLRLDRVSLDWKPYRLIQKKSLTSRVKKFVFTIDDPNVKFETPDFGSFPYVRLQYGPEKCYTRAYSVVRGNKNHFELGIALDRKSRGGSRFLHDSVHIGDVISIANGVDTEETTDDSHPVDHWIIIVGGIGITAFIREIEILGSGGKSFEIHYACPSIKEAVYTEHLPLERTTLYAKDQGQRLDVKKIIPEPLVAEYRPKILCCGPSGLLDACEERLDSLAYPEHLRHLESFGGEDATGEPFEVEILSSHTTLQVPSDKTLLQILNESGLDVPSSCLVGNCGLCMVDYKGGSVKHKGTALTKDQKCESLLSCVSRGKGKIVLGL